MTDWRARLTQQLEPVLKQPDPRPQMSAYHDMPFAIFWYPPGDEIIVRQEVALLRTRLEEVGKRVTAISLAECMEAGLAREGLGTDALVEAEKSVGLVSTVETIHQVLSDYQRLDDLVMSRIPADADPLRDLIFIVRAGALFPVYRTSSLMTHLTGRLAVPGVLFYPGSYDGAGGLSFMGVLEPEHNYRAKIF